MVRWNPTNSTAQDLDCVMNIPNTIKRTYVVSSVSLTYGSVCVWDYTPPIIGPNNNYTDGDTVVKEGVRHHCPHGQVLCTTI